VAAFTKLSVSLPAALAAYVRAEGKSHPRGGYSAVIAEELTRREARGSARATGGLDVDVPAEMAELIALVRGSLTDGAEREARIEIRIAELADILVEVLGQQAADKDGPQRPPGTY